MKLLREALGYKEGVVAVVVTIIGLLICFIGGNFIKNDSISFFIVVVGGFISISGSTEFAKVLRTVRDKMNNE
jgi:ABC-type xylose transport system permease subunit